MKNFQEKLEKAVENLDFVSHISNYGTIHGYETIGYEAYSEEPIYQTILYTFNLDKRMSVIKLTALINKNYQRILQAKIDEFNYNILVGKIREKGVKLLLSTGNCQFNAFLNDTHIKGGGASYENLEILYNSL